MAQPTQRLVLNLADALARDVELAADLLERPGATILETEAQFQHPTLAWRQRCEHRPHLLREELVRGGLGGRDRVPVLHEVGEI